MRRLGGAPGAGFGGNAQLKKRQRLARDAKHLQRARNTLRVLRLQARCRHRVDPGQLGMQRRPAGHGGLAGQLGAHARIGFGHGVEPAGQRLEIKHGAAHQERQLAARPDLLHQAFGVGHEFGGAVGLQGIAYVDQVVRHRSQLAGAGLGGADVHAAVHQRRVHADDLDRVRARNRQRRRRFARGGRAGQRQIGRRVGG